LRGSPNAPAACHALRMRPGQRGLTARRVRPAQVGRGRNEPRCVLAAKPRSTVQRCRDPACPVVRPPCAAGDAWSCGRAPLFTAFAGRLTFTAGLSAGIVSYNRDGPVRRRMRFGRRQVVDADLRIYVQEVRAVHTASANGGMRLAVRLPGMRHGCPPCPPDRTTLPHHVGRSASGRRKVRAQHRRIARPAAILARSCWNDQEVETCPEAETCTDESLSARLTDLASRNPANFPQVDPFFAVRSMAPVAARTRLPVRRADGRRVAAVGER
jgi:hypothetical protein